MKRVLKNLKIKLLLIFPLLTSSLSAQEGMQVIGYVTSYNLSSSYQQIDFCSLTTLNVSFINPDAQGNLSYPLDLTDEINYAKSVNPKLKVFAAIAGGTLSRDETVNGYYRDLLSNSKRAGFIKKIVDFAVDNDYDGIDVDLEGDGIFTGYNEFSIELSAALHAVNKESSVALPWFLPGLVSQNALLAYDYINVMAYDDGGNWKPDAKHHSSMAHMQKCIDFWVKTKGIDPKNIAVGVPFYGYSWDTNPASAYTYRDAANKGYADVDNFGQAWHTGRPVMRDKIQSIHDQGMLGVMIWQLGQDHFGEFSLLKTIDDKIKDIGTFTTLSCDDTGDTTTYIPEKDAIAYFPFESDILDYSTAGRDFDQGTNDGGVIVDDPERGNVMQFDGNSMITIQSGSEGTDSLPSRKEITVSVWVKTESTHEWGGFVGAFQDNGAQESGWTLGTRDQKFSFGITGSDKTINYLTDDSDFDLSTWYNVVATYDGSTIKLFVNGVEKVSQAESGNIFYINPSWFQIGSYKDNDEDNRHDGLLDDVTLWERALTTAEISDLYIEGLLTSTINSELNSNVKLFPNPISGHFTLESQLNIKNWTIVNSIGMKVMTGNHKNVAVNNLSKGLYFINIEIDNGVITKKITIK